MSIVALVDTVTQSPFLAGGALLLVLAIALTVLRGLISLAKKIAIVGGVLLLLFGIVNAVAPEIIPFIL